MTITPQDIAIFVPIIVTVLGAIIGPLYLAKRKDRADLSTALITEQTNFRRDLQERIDKLEDRLDKATQALNQAFDSVRDLRSANERNELLIATLRRELEAAQQRTNERIDRIDHGS